MTVPEMIIDLSEDIIEPRIEDLSIDCNNPAISQVVVESAPGAPQAPVGCPVTPKYSGNTVTLQATPANGIRPYIVTFKKDGVTIDPSRLGALSNPITGAPEDVQITRVYTLNDLDVSSALTGSITFSVEISDSCPITPMTCSSECVVTLGCIAPVCNFTVT